MKKTKRQVELVVISDVHLGTPGSHAKELLAYLQSIKPNTLILNGDIIDMWQFKKRYWPKSHMKVIKQLIGLSTKGSKVYYITGNHDETLRKFSGLSLGNITICNQLSLDFNGEKAWIFHGDVFDVIMQYSKWLAKLGSVGYDLLIQLNIAVNFISRLLGRKKVSLSKKIKDNVKSAVKYINNFEVTAAELASQKGYKIIIYGHIHNPEIRKIFVKKGGEIKYLNSGDWVENLTALEYHKNQWTVYKHSLDFISEDMEDSSMAIADYNSREIFDRMLEEFQK